MVRLIHRRAGIIVNDLGCRCEVCRAHLDEEARQMMQAGLDPSAGRIVDLDLMPAWDEITRQRLELDSRLRDLVMIMFQMVHHPASVKAAQALRASYDHFLCPPKAGAAKTDFCPDLAYMLGHLYITTVIHIPGYEDAEGVQHEQTAADYLWWTEMYADVLDTSDIHLPHALTSSLAARCYGTLLACGWYTREVFVVVVVVPFNVTPMLPRHVVMISTGSKDAPGHGAREEALPLRRAQRGRHCDSTQAPR